MPNFLQSILNSIRGDQAPVDVPPAATAAAASFWRPGCGAKSTTVFSGDAETWGRHLARGWDERGDGVFEMEVVLDAAVRHLSFEAANPRSAAWARALTTACDGLRERLAGRGEVSAMFTDLVFENTSNTACPIRVISDAALPSASTRESILGADRRPSATRILVRTSLLERMEARIAALGKAADPATVIGEVWPVLGGLLLQLGQESYPRDRFIERIDVTTRVVIVSLHVLYDGRRGGRLEPNPAGDLFEEFLSRSTGIPRGRLFAEYPLTRLYDRLSFMLAHKRPAQMLDTARVIVRDFLDERYLRLSMAGFVPAAPEWLRPMPYAMDGPRAISIPKPVVGRYGLIDAEDLDAWNKAHKPLAESGYHIIGQLGMGQFGRVYEAVNLGGTGGPPRVAIKVDRFRKGHKKEAIEAAETIMEIAAGLSRSPHVIRVFDAGMLKKSRCTYHVLQLVEGDTLDHLLGIAGEEHSSVLRPTSARTSREEAGKEFLKALEESEGERWRKARGSPTFPAPPTLGQILDLLTSKALWVEEVHRLGFAVNDLKNGNVMLNRRGQFKGIDLDAYSRIHSHLDKLPDFFFLGVSVLQLVTRGCAWGKVAAAADMRQLLGDAGALERKLLDLWPFGEIAGGGGKVEIARFFSGFVDDARSGRFAEDPARFSAAIDAIIGMKRRLAGNEMVLD